MPSEFSNLGIELQADGENVGLWGGIINDNMDMLDEAISQEAIIPLTGLTYTVTLTDGVASEGRKNMLRFTGTPGGTITITIAPNTLEKQYIIRNETDQTMIVAQGSGTVALLAPEQTGLIYCDGGGVTANVDLVSSTPITTILTVTVGVGKLFTTIRDAMFWAMSKPTIGAGNILLSVDDGTYTAWEFADFDQDAWWVYPITNNIALHSATDTPAAVILTAPSFDDGQLWQYGFVVLDGGHLSIECAFDATLGGYPHDGIITPFAALAGTLNCWTVAGSHCGQVVVGEGSSFCMINSCSFSNNDTAIAATYGCTFESKNTSTFTSNVLALLATHSGQIIIKTSVTMVTNTTDYTPALNKVGKRNECISNGAAILAFV